MDGEGSRKALRKAAGGVSEHGTGSSQARKHAGSCSLGPGPSTPL